MLSAEIHCDGWCGVCHVSCQAGGIRSFWEVETRLGQSSITPPFTKIHSFPLHAWQLGIVLHVTRWQWRESSSLCHSRSPGDDPTPPSITRVTGHFDIRHSPVTHSAKSGTGAELCVSWCSDTGWLWQTQHRISLLWDTGAFRELRSDYDLNYLLWGGDKISRSWHSWWFYWAQNAQMLNGVSGDLNIFKYLLPFSVFSDLNQPMVSIAWCHVSCGPVSLLSPVTVTCQCHDTKCSLLWSSPSMDWLVTALRPLPPQVQTWAWEEPVATMGWHNTAVHWAAHVSITTGVSAR